MPSAICKAKDPRTCPYHGAVIRMNEAAVSGDVHEYFEARKLVEEAEKNDWNEDNLNEALTVVLHGTPATGAVTFGDYGEPLISASEVDRVIPRTDGPRAQAGELFDSVTYVDPQYPDNPTTYHRRRDGVYAGTPYSIRIQTNRKLDDQDVEKLASLLGYSYRTSVAGERLGWPVRDTPYSFIVDADTTKSSRDDLGMALEQLEEEYPQMVQEGSPMRKRGDVANTRAIEGFNDDNLQVHFYYDDVFESGK